MFNTPFSKVQVHRGCGTAHAHMHCCPETKSKVRPKKNAPDSEVRHVRCDYVMHYSSGRKRESWRVRNTEKQGEGEIYVKLV